MPPVIFRRGLDAREAVAGALANDYHSPLVEQVKAAGYRHQIGRLEVFLAREFGFCYGVDRAVDYAYQANHKFPGRRVFLTGGIIHNPHVNERLRAMGIRFLSDWPEWRSHLGAGDVVILPAFGVDVGTLGELEADRLHAGGHHLWLRAERVEERPAVRAGRVHLGHPRQGSP